jgi:Fe-S-cluster-containing dehydrogenase component
MTDMLSRSADEFPLGAAEWPADMSRRQFIEIMSASLALAGLGACNRPPDKTIVPYVTPPDRDLLDAAVYYATAMPWEGFARGLLALSQSGRPTKLEGNPAQPDSQGATDYLMQAAVLLLYDPDRSRTPRHNARPATWNDFEDAWLQLHRALTASQGARFAILTEPTTSPTYLRCLHRLLDRFPRARWYQHTPLTRFDRNGTQTDYDFARADIVLALDADFLFEHPSSLRYARAFATRRRIENGRVNANRLYLIEPSPSITGAMADHSLAASPGRMRQIADAITDAMDGKPSDSGLTDREHTFVAALVSDLRSKAPNILCVVGAHLEPEFHAWAAALNARLGADGVTHHALPAVRSDGDQRSAGDLSALCAAMAAGQFETLVIADVNPKYTAPADIDFAAALSNVKRRIHMGAYVDETAALCDWHLPASHFLESWADLRAYDGTASIAQPLIAPMYGTRSAIELIHFLGEPPGRSAYDLVRETWQKQNSAAADFETNWAKWLNEGVVVGTTNQRTKPTSVDARPRRLARAADAGAQTKDHATTLVIRPDPTIRDGRWSNNAWLQELPKPGSQLVWDNAAYVSPAFAKARALENGDMIELTVAPAQTATLPVWIAPGQASNCVLVHLGYGRTSAGTVGTGRGFDAYRLRRSGTLWSGTLKSVRKTSDRYALVSTQEHFRMEGRDIVRTVAASGTADTTRRKRDALPSLYPERKYDAYRWGMLIDLATCTGCKACVIACQAENNIPVVGKDQVSRGREMHWLRVDRYYAGDEASPEILHQPVPCMQCETAPCEVVCPTAATVHSSEGLNDMVYNRCIGTRYCSNNCPYKVRRFNFLDYRPPADSSVYLQSNPEVTVRARGVMEKCTYCVQRINAARIAAEREDRRVRDGEVRTACQQACPVEAIVFGDLNDPKSRVRARKAEPTEYVLLEELNTQPRTTYLAKITNKSPSALLDPAHA